MVRFTDDGRFSVKSACIDVVTNIHSFYIHVRSVTIEPFEIFSLILT